MTASIATLLLALAVMETGTAKHPNGDDHAIGKAHEASRYAITPRVWRSTCSYKLSSAKDPAKSYLVARSILMERMNEFKIETKLEPTPEDCYALWSRPGAFAHRGFNLKRLPSTVQDRCARYAALVKDMQEKGTR